MIDPPTMYIVTFELEIKYTTATSTPASYLVLSLYVTGGTLSINVYIQRDNLGFRIVKGGVSSNVNFP